MVCVSPLLSVTVITTTEPSGKSVLPEITGVVSLPESNGLTVTIGACVSILPFVSFAVAVLPCASLTVAVTVKSPSARALGTSALNVPSACTAAWKLCELPLASTTVMVTSVPGATSVVPVIVGVTSLVAPCVSRVNSGASLSTLPVVLAFAVLPAVSVAVAVTVKSPSASAFGTSTLKLPFASTKALIVCVFPALSVTTSVTVLPSGRSVVPESVGVVSPVLPGFSRVSVGAVVSTTPPLSVTVVVLPSPSVALAVTV